MCRLILARGRFDVAEIVQAALGMSTGGTADHESPVKCHPNGWGAVWRDPAEPGTLRVHRDPRTMADSWSAGPLCAVRADVLAIHVRHATLPHTMGERFTHPLQRAGEAMPWYFMHNGFLPTVHRSLGLPASRFDSAEYFDYLVPPGSAAIAAAEALRRLRAIPPGGSSGNAVVINPDRSYVVHWSPPGTPYPRYFSMHRLRRPGLDVVASEVIPALGSGWTPLDADVVLNLPHPPFTGEEHEHGTRTDVAAGRR
ncbi:class II glutamine amidotransferase [Dactylosporangium sp. NPDC050688]|uniref:class II glutamine amidotransferase n=1 Tax=Dactylosporangium sp. NPDC050688 TaxID=3157217 RepID=UPI0033EB9E56